MYIYYIYRKSYFSGENILRENILVEFDEVKITFKTEFSTNTIENEKAIPGKRAYHHTISKGEDIPLLCYESGRNG